MKCALILNLHNNKLKIYKGRTSLVYVMDTLPSWPQWSHYDLAGFHPEISVYGGTGHGSFTHHELYPILPIKFHIFMKLRCYGF